MDTHTSSQNIRVALQRLLEGLQRTLQVFKVFSDDDVERGNIREDSCKQVCSETGQSPRKKRHGSKRKHSPVLFDRRKLHTSERELDNYIYESEYLKVLPAEQLKLQSLRDKICGTSGIDSSFVKQWPGERISVVEQELYNTSIYKQQNPFKNNKPHPMSSKRRTCCIEEIELSDRILVRCKNPDSKPTGKGDNKDVNWIPPPAKKRKYRDGEEPGDAMESCPKTCGQQKGTKQSAQYVDRNRPKRERSADYKDNKKHSRGTKPEEAQRKPRRMEAQSPKRSGKDQGKNKSKGRRCKRCMNCCRKKKKSQSSGEAYWSCPDGTRRGPPKRNNYDSDGPSSMRSHGKQGKKKSKGCCPRRGKIKKGQKFGKAKGTKTDSSDSYDSDGPSRTQGTKQRKNKSKGCMSCRRKKKEQPRRTPKPHRCNLEDSTTGSPQRTKGKKGQSSDTYDSDDLSNKRGGRKKRKGKSKGCMNFCRRKKKKSGQPPRKPKPHRCNLEDTTGSPQRPKGTKGQSSDTYDSDATSSKRGSRKGRKRKSKGCMSFCRRKKKKSGKPSRRPKPHRCNPEDTGTGSPQRTKGTKGQSSDTYDSDSRSSRQGGRKHRKKKSKGCMNCCRKRKKKSQKSGQSSRKGSPKRTSGTKGESSDDYDSDSRSSRQGGRKHRKKKSKGCMNCCRKRKKKSKKSGQSSRKGSPKRTAGPKGESSDDYDSDSRSSRQSGRTLRKKKSKGCMNCCRKRKKTGQKSSMRSKAHKRSPEGTIKHSPNRTKRSKKESTSDSDTESFSSMHGDGKRSSKGKKKLIRDAEGDRDRKDLANVTGYYHKKSHENLEKLREGSDKESRSKKSKDDRKAKHSSHKKRSPDVKPCCDNKNCTRGKQKGEDAEWQESYGKRKTPRKLDRPEDSHRRSPRRNRSGESTEGNDSDTGRRGRSKESVKWEDSDRESLSGKEDRKRGGEDEPIGRSSLSHIGSPTSIGARSLEVPVNENFFPTKGGILDVHGKQREVRADFILVFLMDNAEELGGMLEYYLAKLEKAGLLMEAVDSRNYIDTIFIKVQIPSKTALSLAETFDIKLACTNPYHEHEKEACRASLNTNLTNPKPDAQVYKRNRESVKGEQPMEPTSAERMMVIYELLTITPFSYERDDFGIEEMKNRGIIAAAYPVHDGGWEWTDKGPLNDRQLLKAYWPIHFNGVFKPEPIQHIKKYFGPEAGYYYALLDFYIVMLIPIAVFGLIPTFYGLFTTENPVTSEYCNLDRLMCPLCVHPHKCGFILLNSSCYNSKLINLFDNRCTMVFAAITSIWSIFFLLLWRIKENALAVSWNLHTCFKTDVTIRPEYYKRAEELRESPITGKHEPYVPKADQGLSWLVTICGMLIIVFVVLLTMFLIVFYRIALARSITQSEYTISGKRKQHTRGRAVRHTALISAIITSVSIIIFDPVFDFVAIFLTNIENPRTQTEFDQSCSIKMFLFSCVNNYAMATYLAFFRAVTYTHPGSHEMWNFFFGINADVCDFAGCALDIVIFLTVLIILKLLATFIKTIIVVPSLYKRKIRSHLQWELDYALKPTSNYYFTKLNINLLVQYGFVLFFIPVFPLLPLVALICNVIEKQINALGLLRNRQRPVPRQKCDREFWNKVLYSVTFIGVIVQGCVAAFTANYVERENFQNLRENLRHGGYLSTLLSIFGLNEYDPKLSDVETGNATVCFYIGKYSQSDNTYHRRFRYFDVAGKRLNVFFISVGLVFLVGSILHGMVPTIPSSKKQKVNYNERKAIF